MRRVGSAICGLILCAAVASLPVLCHPGFDVADQRPIETGLPAEIDELLEPKVDERNDDKVYRGSDLDGPAPRDAALFLRLHVEQALRCDDPHGSLTHGLRAPPA